MSDGMAKTFVLGLGAQKAGTTWLYSLLSQNSNFVPGLEKEYHIWDARCIPLFHETRRSLWRVRTRRDWELYAMQASANRYFDHFEGLLTKDGAICADITPSYSALEADTLRQIKDGIEARGITFKCVFIMRDPIKRCLSAFTMNRGRPATMNTEGVDLQQTPDEAFEHYVQSDHAKLRTRYEHTLDAMSQAFGPEHAQVFIYEELFESASVARLETFLGQRLDVDHLNERVHKTDYREKITDHAERICFDTYRDTYHAVAEKCPQVRSLWHGLKTYA